MSHRIEDYTATVTVFEYTVFDQPGYKGFEYEATPEQICQSIWKKYPSAHIVKMTTFGINYRKHIDRAQLNKIENPYAEGSVEGVGPGKLTPYQIDVMRKNTEEINEFKRKNFKLE